MNINEIITNIGLAAKAAAKELAASGSKKDQALRNLAQLLLDSEQEILAANVQDLEKGRLAELDAARMDRLTINPKTIAAMSRACLEIAELPDPIGGMDSMWKRPNELLVGRMRIPLGVIALIYESRPNVTIDASILCLKAGNAVILRGGSEAFHSNTCLAKLVSRALEEASLPAAAAALVPFTDREGVTALCKLSSCIDVIIPRGGAALVRRVTEEATMPVLKHFEGVCHIYVDEAAELIKALDIVENAKVQRPGVCNALECLLVHEKIAPEFLPAVAERLGSLGVSFRACPKSLPYLEQKEAKVTPAREDDFGKEFLDLILAVRTVTDYAEAREHINRYGSGHTEVILTKDHSLAMEFLRQIDASMVGVNCSTRFNDGGELGLGAEIGISTSKLHSYGPMGVHELTTTKFVVLGEGQIR